jgi:NACalpha-BTF3-like transcription factor
MTGAEESAARNVLEAADWNLETAVELHFASQDAGGGGGGGGFGAAASAGAAGAGAGGGDGWGAAGAIGEDGMDDATRAAIAAAQAEMAVDSPEVRKADEHIEDQLFDPQQVSAMQQFQQQQLKKTAVADPFRDLSAGDASKGGLGEMFKTPDELTFKGGFEEARAEAEKCGKLLMVNIQDEQEFHSHMLVRRQRGSPPSCAAAACM